MPLAKGRRGGKKNQGAQWGDTGPAGDIRFVSKVGASDKTKRIRISSKHGRNKSIGRDSAGRRSTPNPKG